MAGLCIGDLSSGGSSRLETSYPKARVIHPSVIHPSASDSSRYQGALDHELVCGQDQLIDPSGGRQVGLNRLPLGDQMLFVGETAQQGTLPRSVGVGVGGGHQGKRLPLAQGGGEGGRVQVVVVGVNAPVGFYGESIAVIPGVGGLGWAGFAEQIEGLNIVFGLNL